MQTRSRLKQKKDINKHHGLQYLRKINWGHEIAKCIGQHKKKILFAVILLIIFLALIPPATYLYFAKDLKNKESIMNRGKTGLTLLDSEGKIFYAFDQPKSISYIALADITTFTQEALIATEDKNFSTNPGFSLRGILRAFVVNFFAGKYVEGGSTITQELARNAFLSQSKNMFRKYQELVLASEINRRFSKKDILEIYLNSVYFGEGAFGIENAAQAYFGISANKLDLAQSALLIGVLPAPSAYSPLSNPPDKAIQRQHIVLNQMIKDGYISQAEADEARNEKMTYNTNTSQTNDFIAPHFALFVRDQLIKQYGEERVVREGFTVTTTIARSVQTFAEQAVKTQIGYLKYNKASNGAAVVIDPKTGFILAMVGSFDWNNLSFGQMNMATAPRQPGSSFKPIIYGRALEDKQITPATILHDVKTTFPGNYTPNNYDLRYRGDVTVRRALANSLNIPAVEVMEKVGVSNGLDEAKKLGITSLKNSSDYGLSLVLGTGEISLLEMTGAYAVFADQGTYHPPTGIREINDKYGNKVIEAKTLLWYFNPLNWITNENNDTAKDVMSKDAAFLISSILSDNYARAEIFGSALSIGRPAAVKTGTTENYRDALTIGYTPSLVVGVWVGNNDNSPMDHIAGSLGAAPIWRSIMQHELFGKTIEQFEKPTFIINQLICPYGGYTGYMEYFIAGTQPDSCAKPTATPQPTITAMPTPTNTPAPTQQSMQPTQGQTIPTDAFPSPRVESPTQTPMPALPTALLVPTMTPVIQN
jgi:1A family penicillin-binding protein